jgi:glutamate-1-semialdehyde 2,1-aminomutase
LPDSPGVPVDVARLTLVCPFNDADAVRSTLERHAGRIAAVIVEPYLGNAGFIPPLPEFLPELRRLTTAHGALLIFDEVMTGFRVHAGGAQAVAGVRPDLTTLGKVIGGGLPVGAYGGRRDLMQMIAPAGKVYQAGTLSGNPLAIAAGLATLRTARAERVFEVVDRRTRVLVEGLRSAARALDVPFWAGSAGSMWGFFFHPGPVTNFAEARGCDTEMFRRFHRAAREPGVLRAPSPFEAAFVSAAHDDSIIAQTVERLADALAAARRR